MKLEVALNGKEVVRIGYPGDIYLTASSGMMVNRLPPPESGAGPLICTSSSKG